MPPSMQADVVDHDAALGGARRAGALFGLWGVATKIPLAVGVGLAFPLLEMAGFNGGDNNSAQSLLTLALLYGGLPVLFKLLAIRLIWNYDLDQAAHARLTA